MGNRHEGAQLTATCQPPAAQEWFPIETVSKSESGFERVYQGSCLIQRWPLRLSAGAEASFESAWRVSQRERASASS